MPHDIRRMNEVPLNPYEALKRAYIKHGYIPKYFRRSAMGYPTIDHSGTKPKKKDPGLYDYTKPPAKGPEKEKDKQAPKGPPKKNEDIFDVTANSQDVLYECTTVFPFTLFPDTVKLDREKLTIANRFFWQTANITSTPVSEIMSIEATVGPIFGSVHLTFRFFTDNQRTVNWLWRDDAKCLQRLLHGYIIAQRKELDTSHIKLPDLKKLLMELGQGASD